MDNRQIILKGGRRTLDNVANVWSVPKIGRRHMCRFFDPDSYDNDNTMVFKVSVHHAMSSLDENKSACYFGSALCAFCPALTTVVKNDLQEHGIELNVIKVPSKAANNGVDLVFTSKYDKIEIYTLVGSFLLVLFKSDTMVISDRFMNNTSYALAKKLGMPDVKIWDFVSIILPNHAKAIYNVLGTNNTLKKEVEEYLTWLSKRKEKIALMASFVLERKNKFI